MSRTSHDFVWFWFSENTNSYESCCEATNKESEADQSLFLVADDCFRNTGGSAETTINPREGTTACTDKCFTELIFNQFAFDDSSQSVPSLSFHMKCEIAVGEAACSSPQQRKNQDRGSTYSEKGQIKNYFLFSWNFQTKEFNGKTSDSKRL